MDTYTTYSTKRTSQSESIPGRQMVENSAGGFTFEIDDWQRLDRFLVLGSAGGTYYVRANKLTKDNADGVLRCIKADGPRTVGCIVEVSLAGRAPKNDPALFALAMCAGLGDSETKKVALDALSDVARIGTHLFHFATYVEQFRGWGRALSNAVKKWYQDKSVDRLAYQAVKYQSRDGWSHRDLLRLAHPKPDSPERGAIYKWIVSGESSDPVNRLIEGFEKAKVSARPDPGLIREYGLTREMVPTDWLNSVEVWAALLEKMPMTAIIRNLGKMSSVGLLKPMSKAVDMVTAILVDQDELKRARIHPLSVLMALKVYGMGHGVKGKLSWDVLGPVMDALNKVFYLSFGFVRPTNKRILLGLDVSASMTWENIAGMLITPREASAAMALVTAATERQYHIMGFCGEFIPLSISPRHRLDDVVRKIENTRMGSTDCAFPMLWALANRIEVDAFIIYTDNETWSGGVHPCQALKSYRQQMGIPAKLAVVGMTATEFSIADPNDFGMMDVVGFDSAAPNVMSDWIRGVQDNNKEVLV